MGALRGVAWQHLGRGGEGLRGLLQLLKGNLPLEGLPHRMWSLEECRLV